jgi:hypothetical protein
MCVGFVRAAAGAASEPGLAYLIGAPSFSDAGLSHVVAEHHASYPTFGVRDPHPSPDWALHPGRAGSAPPRRPTPSDHDRYPRQRNPCKRLHRVAFVEAHRQRIWVEDAPGGGARFCFTLPVAASISDEPKVAALMPEELKVAADSRH